jgi:hypothetical protein
MHLLYRVIPSVLDPRKCEYLKDYSLFNLIFLNKFYIYKIINIYICKYITYSMVQSPS